MAANRFHRGGRWEEGEKRLVVAMRNFPSHVTRMHSDGNLGFSEEYEAIQQVIVPYELKSTVSERPDNKVKNRYLHIWAYDHTRVKFLPQPGHENQDEYINANFIDGFEKRAAYIGTQGPLPLTFAYFWRMVWEQNAYVLVMITNLIEDGERKCDMYWPREGTEIYGNVSVTLENEEIKATYTVRIFRIRFIKAVTHGVGLPPRARVVRQFHYTNWPDHGVPDHTLQVLRFIHKSSHANPPHGGPIVVHCSAGVGRTGSYIVLDSMLKMVRTNKEVDVFNFLKHIRTQRNFLVQTKEQYIFIHDALVEAIESGDTYIHQAYLKRYLSKLVTHQNDTQNQRILLENQYTLATNFQPMENHFLSAKKSKNTMKNCDNPLLPMEAFRVHLSPKPDLEESDYVNASWFMGYHRLHEFIVTGAPCGNSLISFWQMMWDHNVRSVAMFINFEDSGVDPFWPTGDEEIETETFKLRMAEEGQRSGVLYRDFSLISVTGELDWILRIFFFPTWPKYCDPVITSFDAIDVVQDWNAQFLNAPIVLVDRHGSSQAATFCTLASVKKQLMSEGFADVYTFVKLYHMSRPGCWINSGELLFLYNVIVALSEKISRTTVPMVPPEFEGLGPTVYPHTNN